MHIPGHKQVQPSVAVVVAPRSARRPVTQRHPGLFRDVGKRPIVVIVIQPVRAPVGNKNVWPALLVVIGHGNPKPPAIVGHPSLRGDVCKRPIMVVMKKRGVRRRRLSIQRVERRSIHQVDVQPAIVVVIDQADARPIRLKNQLLLGCPHHMVPTGQARSLRRVLKDDGPAVHNPARCNWQLRGRSCRPLSPSRATDPGLRRRCPRSKSCDRAGKQEHNRQASTCPARPVRIPKYSQIGLLSHEVYRTLILPGSPTCTERLTRQEESHELLLRFQPKAASSVAAFLPTRLTVIDGGFYYTSVAPWKRYH